MYEVNTNDLKQCIKKHKFVWLHIWKPGCSGQNCTNLDFYTDMADKYKISDLEFYIISDSYEVEDAQKTIKGSRYDKPMMVLQDSWFGHDLRWINITLAYELDNHLNLKKKYGYFDFLFRDSLLMFAGLSINDSIIQSYVTPGPN